MNFNLIKSILITTFVMPPVTKCYNFTKLLYSTPLIDATVNVLNGFYIRESSTLSMLQEYTTVGITTGVPSQSDVINAVLLKVQPRIAIQFEGHHHIVARHPRFYVLIFVDTYESFRVLIHKHTRMRQIFDFTGYFLIVLTKHNTDQMDVMRKIFTDCFELAITNVNVLTMMPTRLDAATMYTFYPFSPGNCRNMQPIVLNRFEGGEFILRHELFPNKVKNMHRCPVYVTTFETPPFMMFRKRQNGSIITTDGIEGIIFRVLSQRLQFTPVYIFSDDPNVYWGTIFPNGTGTGSTGLILGGRANITMGSYGVSAARLQNMDSTFSYFQSSLVFVVPPGRSFSSLQKLFKPFRHLIWAGITMCFMAGIVLLISVKFLKRSIRNFLFGRKNRSPLFNMVGICLSIPMPREPTRNFARTIILLWLLGALVLNSSYKGSLYDHIQRKTTIKRADTFDEMIRRNYTFYMGPSGLANFAQNPDIVKRAILIDPINKYHHYWLFEDPENNAALYTSAAHVAYYKKINKSTNIEMAKQNINAFPISMYMQKYSYLTHTVNLEIMNYLSSGLLDNWIKLYVEEKYYLKQVAQREPEQFTNRHLYGVYQLCFFMYAWCIAAFVLEVLTKRFRKLKLIMDFLEY